MHHFIFPTADSWISSGSSTIDGTSFKDQNFGRDQILEVKKFFYNNSFDHQTRALINFEGTEFTNVSKSIVDDKITSPKFYLKLYEAEGNSELSEEYKLHVQPISQSWTEGTGKFGDNPKNTNGASWENKSNFIGSTEVTWSTATGTSNYGVSVNPGNVSSSVQSFSNESPDVNVEVTDMVKAWLSGSINNYGMLVRFSGSQETDSNTFGHLKFFSRQTHTIYSPKLEVRWEDSSYNTGDLLHNP